MRKPRLNGFHLDGSCVTPVKVPAARGKSYLFRGDKSADNGDNLRRFFCLKSSLVGNRSGKSSVTASRLFMPLIAATIGCIVLQPSRAQAQWWPRPPADFEDCADAA